MWEKIAAAAGWVLALVLLIFGRRKSPEVVDAKVELPEVPQDKDGTLPMDKIDDMRRKLKGGI